MAKRSRKRRAQPPPPSAEGSDAPSAPPSSPAASRFKWMPAALAGALALAAVGYFFREGPAAGPAAPAEAPGAAARLIAGSPDYVDPATCAGCHPAIAASYAETGMGRSFYRAAPERMRDHLGAAPAVFEHEASGRRYTFFERDGAYFLRREAVDAEPIELRIDYVMGSGNHARSYLHRLPDGRLLEAPVGWYAAEGGYLAMSPGFDGAVHSGLRREITFDCLGCHNGYPAIEPGADAPGLDAQFAADLPEGIDCQRCHGPGRAHVEAVAEGAAAEEIRAAILNPADLGFARQLEVCMQCHLESTSRRLPYAVRRFDRHAFSYEPSEPLVDSVLHFDHPEGVREDKFEIAHAAYRLRKSACFRQSASMTCTTCHDPHHAKRGAAAAGHYRAVCLDCHQAELTAQIAAGEHPAERDCLPCHMPKRRTDDVVHVVMTDHFIQRRPPERDLLAPLPERREGPDELYTGPVELYYPPDLPATPENSLYLAVAQVIEGANLEAGVPQLRTLLERYEPEEGAFYFHLAEAYWLQGRYEEALPWYEEALERSPDHLTALRNHGVSLSRLGRHAQAEEAFRRALDIEPNDAEALVNLAETLNASGRPQEAEEAAERALRQDPLSPEAYQNLALAQLRQDEARAAIAAAREALRIEPRFATARGTLANALAAEGRSAEAEEQYQKAIADDPDYAEAHYNYGAFLAEQERYADAERRLRTAVRLAPDLAAARVNLGAVFGVQGRAEQALAEFRRAVEADPSYAPAHYNLGTALARRGELEEAAHSFSRALELDPEYVEARLNRGITRASLGETAAARRDLEQAAAGADPALRRLAEEVLSQLPH